MAEKNVSELLNIVEAGAGVTMEATHFSFDDILPVAVACGRAGVPLHVHGAMDWRTKDLITIAKAGKGQVVFI
ncbi:MAG: hypothetical protein ACFCUQ_03230 [Kiloniellales bacterium]